MKIQRWLLPALGLLMCASCSDSDPPVVGDEGDNNGAPTDAGGADGASGEDGGGDEGDDGGAGGDGGEDAVSEDAVDEEVMQGTRETGELCTADRQCLSSLCLFLDADIEQGFCSNFCFSEEDCPDDEYDCVPFENSGSDLQSICLPGDLCLDADEDSYGFGPGCLGNDCDDDDPDVNAGADEVCDGVDNDCDGNIDLDAIDDGVMCMTGEPGICADGVSVCEGGELRCEALRQPSREICDGIDNDCDGLADEGEDDQALREVCYSGPEGTEGVGACQAGARVCEDGRISDCLDQVLPSLEVCDGVDNDCDGEVDEGNPGEGVLCDTGAQGVCARGVTRCEEGQVLCVPLSAPEAEVCDERDNDCDGLTDEGDDDEALVVPCYDGPEGTEDVGTCRAGGRLCTAGQLGPCRDQVLPEEELCDTLDNDCDGESDEGNPAGGFACDTGLEGICASGETLCTEEGTICNPLSVAGEEICDGLDNDCDGLTDEDEDGEPLTRRCYDGEENTDGVGVCQAGAETCDGGQFGACEDEVIPSLELCDGIDNDCDGEADEANPGGGVRCDTGEQGVCGLGVTNCAEGAVVCEQVAEPVAELCDGVDNDCDGSVDEDEQGETLTRRCYDGPELTDGVGACRAGAQLCAEGLFANCEGQVLPEVEVCDGIDNDCDGEIDEEVPGVGVQCDTGLEGVCAEGRTTCTDGELECQAVGAIDEEICDGRDNDCDGLTDEDEDGEPLTRRCYDGEENTDGVGVCQAGTETCDGGQFGICDGQVLPSTERCDGRDNDCDGVADEDNPGANVQCDTGQQGVCAAGITLCTDEGELECQPIIEAGEEICDGLDNDCDGQTDEDEDGEPLTRRCYDGEENTDGVGVCQAGTETCDGGQFGICDGQVLPSTERCDGQDNDCDDSVDEGDPGGGVGCTTGLRGVCSTGVSACESGRVVCVPDAVASDEICDGLDNDCDGLVDDGFPGLGEPCFSGQGICRRAGITVCDAEDRSGPPICDAEEGPGNDVETCDFNDDDCDGEVDEDFRTDGVYDGLEHCGSCGISCNAQWPGGPEIYNVVPRCEPVDDSAVCAFDCIAPFADLDGVPDNGCEFTPDPEAIYVSRPANGGDDANPSCGDFDAPCATIGRGLARADDEGRARVRVSDGLYREEVRLVSGVDLLGGHNARSWNRDPEVNVTVITGQAVNPQGPDRLAVVAEGITTETEFSGFTVNAENAAAGGNSVGLYILNSDESLLARDNIIFGGNGGSGTSGQAGQRGVDGADGQVGLQTRVNLGACNVNSLPGAGGARLCGGVDVSGGDGGAGTCPSLGTRSGSGEDGTTAPGPFGDGGAGGQGGGHLEGIFNGFSLRCLVDLSIDPLPGLAGESGDDGSGGLGAANGDGALDNGEAQWRGLSGQQGDLGDSGGGGGGGGAAPGVDAVASEAQVYYGATGGGGGSGGCAGTEGQGGGAGGASFAVFVVFTDAGPANADEFPRLEDNRLSRGRGGQGGGGGAGGAGGDPGLGGAGGDGVSNPDDFFDFCIFDAAIGAPGGRGGHGGGGGGGAGGVSFDVYVHNSNNFVPAYEASNTFEVPQAQNTGGEGGSGGTANNTVKGLGEPGPAGAFGRLQLIP